MFLDGNNTGSSPTIPYLKGLARGVASHAALEHEHCFDPPLRHDAEFAVGYFLGARQVKPHGRHFGILGSSLLPALRHGRLGAGLNWLIYRGGWWI